MVADDRARILYRVLVQGIHEGPFLRELTVACEGLHEILDHVAGWMTGSGIDGWGILAVDEETGRVPKEAVPGVVAARSLDPLQKDEASVLFRPWGCFASETDDLSSLAAIRPGYLRWDEPEQVYIQGNLQARDLKRALENLLDFGTGTWRVVIEYDDGLEDDAPGRLFYADDQPTAAVRQFLSRNAIWALSDGFVGLGIASLDPFREAFVDAHGELLVWWDIGQDDELDRYLKSLGVPLCDHDQLGFVSAHAHIHVEHEMTGAIEPRLQSLVEDWGFYEYREDDEDEDEEF